MAKTKDELPNMPKRDAVGEAAANLAKIISKQKALVTERGEAAEQLLDAMTSMQRPSVTVEGFTFVLEEREAQQKIKVIAPR